MRKLRKKTKPTSKPRASKKSRPRNSNKLKFKRRAKLKSKVRAVKKGKTRVRSKARPVAKIKKNRAARSRKPSAGERATTKKATKPKTPTGFQYTYSPGIKLRGERPYSRSSLSFPPRSVSFSRPSSPPVKRHPSPVADRKQSGSRSHRIHQFKYMKAPGLEHEFEVGDTVEVYCDHEKSRERIRGWVKGIVVQVDNKMVAVQFRSNVFLTDGWMVPDRILWYPVNSEHIRPVPGKKPAIKDVIPDY